MIPEAASHRDVCGRCRRPTSVCYCAHLVSLPTRTRVILLQHPRERHVPIGTARLAHLCLPDSELHVGVNFDDDRQVRAALAEEAGRPAYLLFPGPRAIDLAEAQLAGPITLVVVDGTWWQARNLLKRNAVLAALPQIRFSPRTPSNYRIRREPADHCVATVEALAQVLGALEGAPERFATLLRPFEAMIDTQIHYATHVRGARQRHAL
ncbi:MAG TPA: tRNA-uridine aminocarboxypropyltransferase, partial [Polyangia bacterium]